MIAYVDSSVLVRTYLADEPGHDEARRLLADDGVALVTGTWTRIEVCGALVRAGRSARQVAALLSVARDDLGGGGPVAVVRAEQELVEEGALALVTAHGIRAAGAWHLAVAGLMLPQFAERDEVMAFATRDERQGRVAATMGFQLL